MTYRSTDDVAAVRDHLNHCLEQLARTSQADDRCRGLCAATELLLRQSGRYRGFVYLPAAGARHEEDGTVLTVRRPHLRKYL